MSYITKNPAYFKQAAIAGWYAHHEPGIDALNDSGFISYYVGFVNAIRRYSFKPIIVAPSIGFSPFTNPVVTPAVAANRAANFQIQTGFTIQAWQDSVGAAGVDYSNSGWQRAEYKVDDYYSAIGNALNNLSLWPGPFWADTELFNLMNLVPLGGGQYRPASIARIKGQLAVAANYAARTVVWAQPHHMSNVAPEHHPEAPRLLDAYRAVFGYSGINNYITPASYGWSAGAAPHPNYPDSGGEMFDMKTGDPKGTASLPGFQNSGWVGISEPTAELVADLGSVKQIDWVAVHVLNNNPASIFFPDSLAVSCSQNNNTWQTHTSDRPVARTDGDFVFTNTAPFGRLDGCRYVKVRLTGPGWKFLSESEIVKR